MGSLLGQRIRSLFSRAIDESAYQELEQLFYEADLGATLSIELVEEIRSQLKKSPDLGTDALLSYLHSRLLSTLGTSSHTPPISHKPHVILMVGVNGSGKTTSLAKLASMYRKMGKSVLIAAGDTFRAASVEQLERWAKKIDAELIKSQPNSDPSSVAFDALAAAKARGTDIVLIDTAGRLQTKTELMNELSKIRRICQKQMASAPHETLLVLDATIGQNALDQARSFHSFTPLTGIILTKLDGSAKGGIAIAVKKELNIPILWIGTGEQADDLAPFEPRSFINALLNYTGLGHESSLC